MIKKSLIIFLFILVVINCIFAKGNNVYIHKYADLRAEIIKKTGVDITYPEGDCKMNETFFKGEINTTSCMKVEVEDITPQKSTKNKYITEELNEK